jgi:hypothetical protein
MKAKNKAGLGGTHKKVVAIDVNIFRMNKTENCCRAMAGKELTNYYRPTAG